MTASDFKSLVRRLGLAAIAVTALAGGAHAQQPGRAPGVPSTTGSIAPAPAPEVLPWSGESGASGHPDMTADAIRAAAADFPQCLERLWPLAARRKISRATFDAQTKDLTPDLRIMDLLDSQPEFTKAIWDYLDILVNDARIERGRQMLETYRAVFDKVEHKYGVDRFILAAIWGVETNYGELGGERSVVRSTATLACIGRRQQYFQEEFLAALEIINRGDVPAGRLVGSWAGAFGPTQFMPTTFKRYAVDFDGDGRRDVVDTVADVMASTANNFKGDGWAPGRGWGYEVSVPATLDFTLADKSRVMSLHEWQRLGVVRANGKPFPHPGDKAFLLIPAGVQGPGFLMTQNFRVILKYNPAEAYALAIGYLADRLRGEPQFVQAWPRYERVLTRAERLELQQLLARHGFDIGEPDGLLGSRTRAAIRDFQVQTGQVPDGFASAAVLDRLRAR